MLALTACSSSTPSTGPEEVAELNRGTALIETEGPSALLYVTIAETAEQRSVAFEDAPSLHDDEGLAFLYFEPTNEEFTTESSVPLSLAFFDVDGRVLAMVDVDACPRRGESCPVYDPGVTYLGVLGVADGLFEQIGVEEGAVVEIVPGSE